MKPTSLIPAPSSSLRRASRSIVEEFWSGKDPKTIRAYRTNMERMAAWAEKDSVEVFSLYFLSLGPGGAYQFANDWKAFGLTEKKWSPAYVNNHLATLRSLVKFARRIEHVVWSLDIKDVPAEAYRDTRGPGFDGLVAIIRAAASQVDPWTAARDTAIVSIMATMGLRLDELVSLDLEHVDVHGRRVLVKRKKKIQRVWVTVPPETLATLTHWLRSEERRVGKECRL